MKLSGVTATFVLLLLLVLLPASLAAISVFDVIRLSQERYADEEVIRLIRTTDSRFFLSAEDTIRLRKEGVTEAVIREMLSRPAPKREGQPPASEGADKPSLSPEATRGFRGAPTGARPGPLFSASSFEQRDAGHALASVTLAGMEVLAVRDRDGFASSLARARAVAGTLNGLAARPAGRFAVRVAGPDTKVAFEASGGPATDVLTVTPADVAGYRAAGVRQVSAATLASLWASLLNDYWGIMVIGKR
jgi:hypothetical protein